MKVLFGFPKFYRTEGNNKIMKTLCRQTLDKRIKTFCIAVYSEKYRR